MPVKSPSLILAEKVAAKFRAENEEPRRVGVKGTVSVLVDGIDHEYDYTATVDVSSSQSIERHPYGMGHAEEVVFSDDIEGVDIETITPLTGGPEDAPEVLKAIKQDAVLKI